MYNTSPGSLPADAESLIKKNGFGELTEFQKNLVPYALEGRPLFINTARARGKNLGLALFVLLRLSGTSGGNEKTLVVTQDPPEAAKLGGFFSSLISSNRLPFISYCLEAKKDPKREGQALSRNPDIIIGSARDIIDRIRKNLFFPAGISCVAVFLTKEELAPGFDKDLFFILSKVNKKAVPVLFSPGEKPRFLMDELSGKTQHLYVFPGEQKKEERTMAAKITEIDKRTAGPDGQLVEKTLKELTALIKSDKYPKEMDEYKKLIKRHVPLTLRAYIGAYLLRALVEGDAPAGAGAGAAARVGAATRVGAGAGETRKTDGSAKSKSYATLFFSIGKNRKIFPKDLAKYITSALSLDPEDLGAIKVLESYSFVDINSRLAEKAVNTLNGQEFRGRPVTVNFAHKK